MKRFLCVIACVCAVIFLSACKDQTPSTEPKPTRVAVTLDLDGGEIVGGTSHTAVIGENLILQTPTKYGYDFVCWTYKDSEISLSPFSISEYSVTLKAKWARKPCTVTLDLNGGSLQAGQDSTVSVKYGESATLPTPTKVGYAFDGWIYNSGAIDFNPFNIENLFEMTVKAKWSAKKYAVNLDFDGGEIVQEGITLNSCTCTQTYNQALDLPIPSKRGYEFSGYTIGGERFESSIWDLDVDNPTLKAVWEPVSVTYVLNADGAVLENEGGIIKFGSSTDSIKEISVDKKGYNFNGWLVNGERLGDKWNYLPTSGFNVTLIADFSPKSYTVTLNAGEGVLTGETQFELVYGKEYNLPVPTPIEGKEFLGWKIEEIDTTISTHKGYGVYNYDYSGELVAEYTELRYLIFIHIDGTIEKIEIDEEVELSQEDIPTPKGLEGYEVIWDVADGDIIDATETIEIKAVINKTHSYLVKFMSGGLELFSECYQYGQVVTLPDEEHEKVAKEGYEFLGWSFSSTDKENYINGEYKWTFAKTVKLYPVYSPASYTITYSLDSIPIDCSLYNGENKVNDKQEVLFNSNYELYTVKVEGDLFTVKWMLNGVQVPYTGVWSMASDVTLVAVIDQYNSIEISVKVNPNDGTGANGDSSCYYGKVTLGKQIGLLKTAPTPPAGKKLVGYSYRNKTYALSDIWDVVDYDGEELIAQYEDVQEEEIVQLVTVKIDLNGGSGSTRAQIQVGKTLSSIYPKPTAKDGYKLAGFIYNGKFYALSDVWDVESYDGSYLIAQYEDDSAYWGPTV